MIKKVFILNFLISLIFLSFICADEYYNTTTSELDTIYFNNFENNNGGLYDSNFDFVVDDPDNPNYWNWNHSTYINSDNTDLLGDFVWGTNNGDMYNPGDGETVENNVEYELRTPIIERTTQPINIQFNYYISSDDYCESFWLYAFTDEGNHSYELERFTNNNQGGFNSWETYLFSNYGLNSYTDFYFECEMRDECGTSSYREQGWYMDNLLITQNKYTIIHEGYEDTNNTILPYYIRAQKSDSFDWFDDDLYIVYSINGGEEIIENMQLEDNGHVFPINPQNVGDQISYYFYAIDNNGDFQYVNDNGDNFSFTILEYDGDVELSEDTPLVLVTPTNLSYDNPIYLKMKWEALFDEDVTYTVQYGSDTEFSEGSYIEKKGLTDTQLYNPVDFIKGELYYWRVYALTEQNDTIWANNGEYAQFGISTLPSIVSGVLDIPANRTIIPENNPYFFEDASVENFKFDTLTVRPGVVCEMSQDLNINGHLIADGTESDKIIFRKDETGSGHTIYFLPQSPELTLDWDNDNFDYISGQKFSHCVFDGINIDDLGRKGAHITNCDFINHGWGRNRIARGYIEDSHFTNTSSLHVCPAPEILDTRRDFKILKSSFNSNDIGNYTGGDNNNYQSSLTVEHQDSVFISHCDFIENSTNGAFIIGANLSIDSSRFSNNSQYGLYKLDGSWSKIQNSEFTNNSSSGLTANGGTNEFYNNIVEENGWDGMTGNTDLSWIVVNNIFHNNAYIGLDLYGGGTFSDNQFVGNDRGGARIKEGDVVFENNHVLFNVGSGHSSEMNTAGVIIRKGDFYYDNDDYNDVIFRNNIINGNESTNSCTSYDRSMAAVTIQASGVMISNNIISDNSSYRDCVQDNLSQCSTGAMLDNTGADRSPDRSAINSGAGLSVRGKHVKILNNTIEDNSATVKAHWEYNNVMVAGGGLFLEGENHIVRGNSIKNNSIEAENTYRSGGNSSDEKRRRSAAAAFGGGIFSSGISGFYNNSNVIIDSNFVESNKIIHNNYLSTHLRGAGICFITDDSGIEVTRNLIKDNTIIANVYRDYTDYYKGIGVYFMDWSNSSRFSQNTILNNKITFGESFEFGELSDGAKNQIAHNSQGGGYYGATKIDSCTISNNAAGYGGGTYFPTYQNASNSDDCNNSFNGDRYDIDSEFDIDYSTITNNTAYYNYGASHSPSTVTNSIIVGNKVIWAGEFDINATGGMYSDVSYAKELSDLRFSNIYDNTGFEIRVNSVIDVDGTYVWWDTRSDQVGIDENIYDAFEDPSKGTVTYQPFLTFSSDRTPGQIEEFNEIKVYTDNTYQMELDSVIGINQRFFIEMLVVDGNENSIDMSAVKVENITNGDYIGPIVVETNLNTGIFRGSAITSSSLSNFVLDSIRVSDGDMIKVSPYDYPDVFSIFTISSDVSEILLGDVNSDQIVNIQDIVTLINYILSIVDEIDFFASDINQDSFINIMDVIGVINIILDDSENLLRDDNNIISSVNLNLSDFISSNSNTFSIPLDFNVENGSIGGIEIEFEYENINSFKLSVDNQQIESFCNSIDENKYKCLILSLNENQIDSNGLVNLNLDFELNQNNGMLYINDLIISDKYGQEASLEIENSIIELAIAPNEFNLGNNYPNPFNPSTTIVLGIPENITADISIINIKGQVVRNLISLSQIKPGYHEIIWNGRNNSNQDLPSGVYFLHFSSDKFFAIEKMTLIR